MCSSLYLGAVEGGGNAQVKTQWKIVCAWHQVSRQTKPLRSELLVFQEGSSVLSPYGELGSEQRSLTVGFMATVAIFTFLGIFR